MSDETARFARKSLSGNQDAPPFVVFQSASRMDIVREGTMQEALQVTRMEQGTNGWLRRGEP